MTEGFVWFHNSSEDPAQSSTFYQKLLGWRASDGLGGLTMLAGEHGPFAAVAQKDGESAGWIPYVQVDDVDAATKEAKRLGARVLSAKTRGPAGEFTVIRDPGGAPVALWQKV